MSKIIIHTGGDNLIRKVLFPWFCDHMDPLNMTCILADTRHSLYFKRGQVDFLSGSYWPLNCGQIKNIFGSFTKCQLACPFSTYICIPPSFSKFVKVLSIHHSYYLLDYLNTYLYWYLIGILTIIGREDLARTIKESIYIGVNNPKLNRNVGKYNLHHIWDRVLFSTPEHRINNGNGHAHRMPTGGHAQTPHPIYMSIEQ